MKITIEKGELQKKLADIQNIVEKRNTMPILNNFLLTAESTEAMITATDLETALQRPIAGTIVEAGTMCIQAKKLFEIVRELNGEVVLESDGNQWLKVKCGKSHFRLTCIAADDYPHMPVIDPATATTIDMPAEMLLEAIEKTLYCAGEADTRYVLNGLLFDFKVGQVLNVVGTDGHRLAFMQKKLDQAIDKDVKVILSRKSLSELRKFLDGAEQPVVTMTIGNSHILFSIGDVKFTARLIEGTYPNYEQVMPSDNHNILHVEREGFAKALKLVSILSKEKSNAVKVSIGANALEISSSNPDLGDAKDELPIKYDGASIETAFNARFLMDALAAMESDTITIKLNEALSPVLMVEEGKPDYKCVVMPMRV